MAQKRPNQFICFLPRWKWKLTKSFLILDSCVSFFPSNFLEVRDPNSHQTIKEFDFLKRMQLHSTCTTNNTNSERLGYNPIEIAGSYDLDYKFTTIRSEFRLNRNGLSAISEWFYRIRLLVYISIIVKIIKCYLKNK
jgi:hypothetical protein